MPMWLPSNWPSCATGLFMALYIALPLLMRKGISISAFSVGTL